MKINPVSLIEGMSGKLAKIEDVVFSRRYGNIHAWRVKAFRGPYSDKQLKVQDDFRKASELTAADMANPETKAEWELIAKQSKGKWKTARGAAFASHMKSIQNDAAQA